jgi:hypothetical protein
VLPVAATPPFHGKVATTVQGQQQEKHIISIRMKSNVDEK